MLKVTVPAIDVPVPSAANSKQGANVPDGKRGATLVSAVKKPEVWPTPAAHEPRLGWQGRHSEAKGSQESLTTVAMKAEGRKVGEEWNKEQLNPEWVEWLMSWPIGWTSLDDLESDEILNPSIEPDIPRVTKNTKNRAARLKAIGNGQFSLCVVKAWRLLTNEFR